MTKNYLILFFTIFIFSCKTNVNTQNVPININAKYWKKECLNNTYKRDGNKFTISLNDDYYKSKRCEFASTDQNLLNNSFNISFTVTPEVVNKQDKQWHSIFQVHSFPDLSLGEHWRCPIISVEVNRGKFRIFNRWDDKQLSLLKRGTCASSQNSISGRLILDDFDLEEGRKYQFNISGYFSFSEKGFLKVSINNILQSESYGPNAFNDKRGPYFKFGIYKPTTWSDAKKYTYVYENIVVK